MKNAIQYGDTAIDYELLMVNRKSLEIAVHPDKSVVVKAPLSASPAAVEERLRKRARWIKRQIAYFMQFDPRTPPRRYVGGESHLYLGRKYRLKISESARDHVLLKNGYFYIASRDTSPTRVKLLLNAWYRNKAKLCFTEVFNNCWANFNTAGLEKPTLQLRRMETRWGSLSPRGRLTLNPRLIQTPKECIEYVVLHELCHLVHSNHTPGFYRLLERDMPDWTHRKTKLELSLV